MTTSLRRFLCLCAYALSMALLEAAIVVYLRGLLGITNDSVSLGAYRRIEMFREAATLVMLASVGWLAGRHWRERLAYGLFTFGLWDIGYYIWLKAFLGWPASLTDWDILFLIPVPWWGPVLAPAMIATLICLVALLAVLRMERGGGLHFSPARLASIGLGACLALATFMLDAVRAWAAGRPDWNTMRPASFHWLPFLLAYACMALPAVMATLPDPRRREVGTSEPSLERRLT